MRNKVGEWKHSCSQTSLRLGNCHSIQKEKAVLYTHTHTHTHTHRWLVSTCPKEGRAVTLSWTLWPGQWHSIPSFRPAATSSVLIAPPQTHTYAHTLRPPQSAYTDQWKGRDWVRWRTAGHSPLSCLLRGCTSVCGYMWVREKLNSLLLMRAIGTNKKKKEAGLAHIDPTERQLAS